MQTKGLCFGCLKTGHHSKNCEKRSVCDTCKRKHPTCLHEDHVKDDGKKDHRADERKESWKQAKEKESSKEKTDSKQSNEASKEATSKRVVQNMNGTYMSIVIPVWLSTKSNPEHEVLVYAFLDNQSDTTFILNE